MLLGRLNVHDNLAAAQGAHSDQKPALSGSQFRALELLLRALPAKQRRMSDSKRGGTWRRISAFGACRAG